MVDLRTGQPTRDNRRSQREQRSPATASDLAVASIPLLPLLASDYWIAATCLNQLLSGLNSGRIGGQFGGYW
jgi:hypothetical protein